MELIILSLSGALAALSVQFAAFLGESLRKPALSVGTPGAAPRWTSARGGAPRMGPRVSFP